jgi:hypothetical protein
MTEGLEAAMEEFDIREATPEDAEKIIAYLAQVGGETDYLSLEKKGFLFRQKRKRNLYRI